MVRRCAVLSVILGVLVGTAPALAASPAGTDPPQAQSITATGTGQSRVHPKNRNNNASIAAAYEAARKASISSALRQAREYAAQYAKRVGLTLGTVLSVSDAQNGYYGPGAFYGPFGPGQFCGTISQPVFKRVHGKRKLVRFKKVRRCFVPQFAFVTLTVTYAAS